MYMHPLTSILTTHSSYQFLVAFVVHVSSFRTGRQRKPLHNQRLSTYQYIQSCIHILHNYTLYLHLHHVHGYLSILSMLVYVHVHVCMYTTCMVITVCGDRLSVCVETDCLSVCGDRLSVCVWRQTVCLCVETDWRDSQRKESTLHSNHGTPNTTDRNITSGHSLCTDRGKASDVKCHPAPSPSHPSTADDEGWH